MRERASPCKSEGLGRRSELGRHARLCEGLHTRKGSWSHIGRIGAYARSAPARCGHRAHRGAEVAQRSIQQHSGPGPARLRGSRSGAAVHFTPGPWRVCRDPAEGIGRRDAIRPFGSNAREERTRLKIVVSPVRVRVSPPPKSPAKRALLDPRAGDKQRVFWASKPGNRRLLAQLSRQQRPTWTLALRFGGARMRPNAVRLGSRLGASDPAWSTTPRAPARGEDAG